MIINKDSGATQNELDVCLHVTDVADISILIQEVKGMGHSSDSIESRQKELNVLHEKGALKLWEVGVRIFNSRFVDEIKNEGTDKAFEKSRLVVQAFNDTDKDLALTQAPTIQWVSQRIILSITAILRDKGLGLYLRDISQAYVQSNTQLNRDFFVRPPKELQQQLQLPKGSILRIIIIIISQSGSVSLSWPIAARP